MDVYLTYITDEQEITSQNNFLIFRHCHCIIIVLFRNLNYVLVWYVVTRQAPARLQPRLITMGARPLVLTS